MSIRNQAPKQLKIEDQDGANTPPDGYRDTKGARDSPDEDRSGFSKKILGKTNYVQHSG